ncbi:PpiC-type peptidyl-prolyl cis-trans isomerase [Flexistipes sinusarabici DSM 4947]|uniref:PpiC-type peptidyl-prolyl cis-trans isomerase n=1 Tax=Flexistipes sinusarabici (strain ATCC 49648 / DSM 4947 / MAS 10) TaxID=717231 RepID=F8E3S2_FLESM|nr:peptidylprolyl isomerase [Flexistipes sinusarabici]AEI14345.1 PpiC-type peptidyl-prolyl cis-trans isomerase [Flexistipes sinusarabici DSM 4947]
MFKVIVLCFFLIIGCGQQEANVTDDSKKAPAEEKSQVTQKKQPVLKINNNAYYVEDIINYAYYTLSEMNEENKNNPEVKKEIIENFIDHKLLLKKAENSGITVDDTKVKRVLDNFKSAFGKENLSTYTNKPVLDIRRLSNVIKEQLIIQKFLAEKLKNIKLEEKDLKNYYDEFVKRYKGVTLYHIYHLVADNAESAGKARQLMRQRHAFSDVAKKFSVGPLKEEGGDMGYVDISNYPAPFQQVKEMRIGSVSSVIKSDYGYHIFKLVDIKRNIRPDFKEIKSKLYSELFIKRQDELLDNLTKELRSNAKITISDNVSFVLSPKPPERSDN